MLKRIALAAVFAVSVAFVGVSVAKAQTIQVTPKAPQGFCFPAGSHC
jgi:hypothetical protein